MKQAANPLPPVIGFERTQSADAKPGGHCLTTATAVAWSQMADEHLPHNGVPGTSPSLTPREPTAFPHWYPCVAESENQYARNWTASPAPEVDVPRRGHGGVPPSGTGPPSESGVMGWMLAPRRSTSTTLMSQPIPISRTIESSAFRLAELGACAASARARNASTDGPAPETTAGTPASRRPPISFAVSGITPPRWGGGSQSWVASSSTPGSLAVPPAAGSAVSLAEGPVVSLVRAAMSRALRPALMAASACGTVSGSTPRAVLVDSGSGAMITTGTIARSGDNRTARGPSVPVQATVRPPSR